MGTRWTPLISAPLILEYESVGKREAARLESIDDIVNAFCFTGVETEIYFRFRPFLPAPGDEFLLELAVAGRAQALVTHNVRHFAGAEQLGVRVMTPGEF